MNQTPQGLLLFDKPSGVTSFDCVAAVRQKLAVKRVGHCGTLDPSARGLLLILVGSATSAQDSFLGLEKQYWFRGELGRKSDTADLDGKIIESKEFQHVTRESLEKALEEFVGETKQTPPMYSALKHKGKPLYRYARQGVDVPRLPRDISISTLSLLSFASPYWDGRVVCSRGTYVRTLIENIAESLGTCSTMVELVRERIGAYLKTDALSMEGLREMDAVELASLLKPVLPVGALSHV